METIKQKLNLIHLCPQLKAGRVGLSLPAFGLGVGGGLSWEADHEAK